MGIFKKKEKKKVVEELMQHAKVDRRLLSHVPDPESIRMLQDRRGDVYKPARNTTYHARFEGQRYFSDFPATLIGNKSLKMNRRGKCIDISHTGMLISFDDSNAVKKLKIGENYTLRFKMPPATLGEGTEGRVTIPAKLVRYAERDNAFGFQFVQPLYEYIARRRDRMLLTLSGVFLFLICFFIIMMRYESLIFLRHDTIVDFYSIVAAVFLLSRYLFGSLYKAVPINPDYTPGVTIIIPCFNEEEWINRTILSCLDQEYPVDKLEVIVVDDCSTDNSVAEVERTIADLHTVHERFKTPERISFIKQPVNKGKRDALAEGVLVAKHSLVAFVDSDSFLEPDAIKHLVQPFADPQVAGVSGRTDVANAYTNHLTKMQAVRYYIAFRIMKAAEAYFDAVMCLSGPLSCYRKSEVLKNLDAWLDQRFLGQKATFGDDRAMTNMIVKENRTYYQDTAICNTIVPSNHRSFLKQQMRWKRSWLRESLKAASFIWRKEPFMAMFFYMGLVIPVIAPVIVIYNLFVAPFLYHIFPTTFILGLFLMAFLMSFAQMLLRKSSLWLYGLWFVVYYEAVLLWQMPWAAATFWVSTWGTRMTPADVLAQQRKLFGKRGRKKKAALQEAVSAAADIAVDVPVTAEPVDEPAAAIYEAAPAPAEDAAVIGPAVMEEETLEDIDLVEPVAAVAAPVSLEREAAGPKAPSRRSSRHERKGGAPKHRAPKKTMFSKKQINA